MGFVTGFTGGVTVTLSLAYLTVLAHRRNREHQGLALRSQALAVQSLLDPIPAPLPPTRSEVAAAQRATTVEVAKDRWNYEIENAVRWVQQTDWDEVRDGFEEGASRLWAKAFGEPPVESGKVAKDKVEPIAREAKAKVEEKAGGIASAAKGAFTRASQAGQDIETTAENKALEARLKAKKAASQAAETVEDKAAEAKGIFASALERGRDIVDKAKSTVVGIAEDTTTTKSDGRTLPALSPVERALHQRYEPPEAKQNKTVADALKERYTPLDQRDNTVLRGV